MKIRVLKVRDWKSKGKSRGVLLSLREVVLKDYTKLRNHRKSIVQVLVVFLDSLFFTNIVKTVKPWKYCRCQSYTGFSFFKVSL